MAQLTDLHSQPNYKSEKKSLINLSPIFNLFLTTPNIGYFICDLGIFLAQSATKVGGFNGLIVTSRKVGGEMINRVIEEFSSGVKESLLIGWGRRCNSKVAQHFSHSWAPMPGNNDHSYMDPTFSLKLHLWGYPKIASLGVPIKIIPFSLQFFHCQA